MERDEELYERLRRLPIPERLIETMARETPLTFQERRALEYASHGLTTRQTADAMLVSFFTASTFRRRAIRHLGAKNTTHAVALAIRAGIFP